MFDKERMQCKILNTMLCDSDDINFGEIMAIYELGKDPFTLITNAFTYGFLKGRDVQ